ncbi:ImpA family type VI secretion system protein [Salibaculum halophilum]|uniref:type VI secretion system protein TssA n=1 Tax=Salibaculum halophilum TaxID=1914408 RepID=UPI000A106141|nr:type VI secretion system ImpA family N-terminal domain-containing protein [Salibaculum halophilum]
MNLEECLAPLSEEDSCGPDLYEKGDSAFESYLLDAEERLPQSFFGGDGNPRLAPGGIDLGAEWERVAGLLARSRDLRLLASYAQFCALARDLAALADCLDLMAGLLEAFPDAVHPRIAEDIIDRNNALELLASRATVIMPLEFTPLVRDRRLLDISLRKILLGRGEREPQGDEEPGDAEAMVAALRAAENADAVAANHAALTRIKQAVGRLEAVCLTNEAQPFRPNLEDLHARLDELMTLLAEARPKLGDGSDDETTEAGEGDDVPAHTGADAAEPDTVPAAAPGRIADMAQARAALEALETYFRTREPSSPSLILVRQARNLVGRPLIEAMEILVPEMSARARIDFGRESGFLLGMDRMRALSEMDSEGEVASADPAEFALSDRKEAGALMSALEAYYTSYEPSSPIPVLLTRARLSQPELYSHPG